MPQVAVSAIQERVRQLCDLPPYTATTPITTDAILDFVTVATQLLSAIVREAVSELYFATSTELETTSGEEWVSLPAEFVDLIRLAWLKSPTQQVDLQVASNDELRAAPLTWGSCPPRYRLVGQNLELFPTPNATYTLKAYFSTSLQPSIAPDVLVLREGWDLWIALQTGILVRIRQQKDASDLQALLVKAEADIRKQLKRDRFGVRQVRDLRDAGRALRLPPGRWY